ncbi:MAG: LAGLIDADG family homing endonuclease [Nitrososphaerota archaeon]
MLPSRRRYLSYYIVGLVDGEGCFSISVKKQDNTRFGWVIDPVFHVSQRKEGLAVLQVLRRFFNCGRIIPKPGQDETMIQYVVDARKHLAEKIIPFFMKHKPIIKWHAFHSFAEIVEALERGEHRSPEGFRKLVEKAYALSQDRKHTLDEILYELRKRVDASETIRWSP